MDGELRLNFEKSSMPMGGGDYRFDKLLLDAYNEANPDARVASLDRAPEDELDKVYRTNWIWEGIVWEGIPSSRSLTRGSIIRS